MSQWCYQNEFYYDLVVYKSNWNDLGNFNNLIQPQNTTKRFVFYDSGDYDTSIYGIWDDLGNTSYSLWHQIIPKIGMVNDTGIHITIIGHNLEDSGNLNELIWPKSNVLMP